ncbi:MAG: DUF2169 domain-containing protein [Pseudomonadota bacterium]
MKTYKPKTYGLSLKSFGLHNKTYLTTTVLVFFDLTDNDSILTEQDLWTALPAQLGSDTPLDQGFPKPGGELVVTGSCFAPGKKTTTGSEISVQVGELQKQLLVFGNRNWRSGGIPSNPEPFAEMPITWANGFGGKEFEQNPLGKGIDPVTMPDGSVRIPLPNIEDPKHLIGSPKDRPRPAGFAPLDMMWPQRFKKCGTYDERWLKERWPWFPDDFNPEFFNVAPADQFVDGFFRGDEEIEIRNMHPDFPHINSRLPGQRPRCFVTKKKELKPEAESEFVEVLLHIDTVWLFPSILRGLVMYRGTTKILDEEYADIERIYVSSEKMAEEPKSIEHYLEEQNKIWNRSVDINMAPLEKAGTKVADMLKKARQMPKQIEQAKLKAMGKAPRMQRSPEEMADNARQALAGGYKLLDEQEAMARKMHAEHGHLMAIDLGIFDRMRQNLKIMGGKIDNVLEKAQEAKKKGEAMKGDISRMLREKVPADELEKAGIDPEELLPPKKVNPWHDRGFSLVMQWRKNLEKDIAAQKQLRDLGLNKDTIKQGWLGVVQQTSQEEMADWGREAEKLDLPAGLVMPRFLEATLTAVRIRPEADAPPEKDFFVPGSEAPPLFLPALGDCAPVIHVCDELEARLVEQEIGDCCSVLAMTKPDEKPDDDTVRALDEAPVVLTVLEDQGDGKPKNWAEWQKVFPTGKPVTLPPGKNLYDVHKKEGIRKWLMAALPDDFAAANKVDIDLPEAGKPPTKSLLEGLAIPRFDVKGMVKQLGDELKAFHQPKVDEAQAIKKEAENKIREAVIKLGKDPDDVMSATPSKKNIAQTGKEISGKILAQRDKLKASGLLSPENEKKMTDGAQQALQLGEDGEKRFQDGMKKLAAGKERIAKVKAGEIPDELKKKFDEAGLDPDALKKLSRQEVIDRHQQDQSLAGTNLNGLDLSELDLSGIDLSKAQCRGALFIKSNLRNARLDQTLAQEADFSGADLQGASIKKGILSKAKLKETDLRGARLEQAILKEADLGGARLEGTRVYMSVLQKANLEKARLAGSDLEMSVFSDAKATEADFKGSTIKKCLFKGTVLDRADFSGAAVPSTLFQGVQGKAVRFTGADMSKGRIGGESQLAGADFTNVTMKQASFRDSNLSGADFRGAVIEASMIENCDMQEVNLTGVSAKKTRFSKSNLERAKMSGLNLFLGSLRKARLVETDLSRSNLFGVDFYKAVMGKTILDGANLKRTLIHKRTEYLK